MRPLELSNDTTVSCSRGHPFVSLQTRRSLTVAIGGGYRVLKWVIFVGAERILFVFLGFEAIAAFRSVALSLL